MRAAVLELRRIYDERQRAGARDTINVAKCLMGRLQPDGTYRRWPIVLTLPDDPDTDDRLIYRGTPPGETVPTHIADCTVPTLIA